jgi:hypothetical protein
MQHGLLVKRILTVGVCFALASLLWVGCKETAPPNPTAANSPTDNHNHADTPDPQAPESPPMPPAVAPAVPMPETVAEKQPVDQVPQQPLFAGWPEPKFVLFVTGQQQGYIEPCGCTGLENQKGGLARRDSLLRELREKRGWTVVPVDVGSQAKRFGRQPEIKFQRTADALRAMGYRAVTLGKDDLRLTAGELTAATNPDDKPSIFVSANVAILARELQPTYTVVEAGGKKIGITGVLGDSFEQKLAGDELIHEPAGPALERVAAELKSQDCDFYVLLAHATLDESRALAAANPIFDLVITAGGVGEPTLELERLPGGKTQMAQVGTKGMYVGVIGVFDDEETPLRYERVPLDKRFPDSPAMLQLLADYQKQLESMGLDELGLKPQAHPTGRKFVGSAACADCHTKAFAVWEKTPHAHATDSLVNPPERVNISRHFDPECLSCHVTGWEPQKIYPFESGYLSLQKTPLLQHNGCENCHGPGSAHVAAETGMDAVTDEEQRARRDAMKLPLAGGVAERKCMECHDIDNSPDFHVKGAFEKYWKEVEHKGKD